MNKLLKDGLILAAIGFVAGFILSFAIYYFSGARYLGSVKEIFSGEAVFNMFVGALQGAVAMGTTVVYGIERWSILRCTATHFVIAMGGFFTMAALQGWLDFGSGEFVFVLVITLIIYVLIWIMQYLSSRRMVRKMNEELKKIKKDSSN